jgi:hypothetical protein
MKFQNNVFTFFFLLIFFFSCVPQSYSVMLPLSTEELLKQSDVVIRGKVIKTIGVWTKDKNAIVTHVYINVIDILRGKLAENTIVDTAEISDGIANPVIIVEHLGGEVDGIGMGMSESPRFQVDEEVVLFLKSAESLVEGTIYIVIGDAQGKYTIDANGIAHKEGFSVLIENEEDKNIIDNDIPASTLLEKIGAGHAFIYIDRRKKK